MTVVYVLVALVVGAVAGYAFRGKVHAGLAAAGSIENAAAKQVASTAQGVANKIAPTVPK